MEDFLTCAEPDQQRRPLVLTYLGVSVTSLWRELGPIVFAAKHEPQLRSQFFSPPLVFPPGVRQNPEVFYENWLRWSHLRLPSGVRLPMRACAHASFGMDLESFRPVTASHTACLHTPAFTRQGDEGHERSHVPQYIITCLTHYIHHE